MSESAVRPADTFAFGENWRRFLEHVGEEQRAEARRSLEEWFGPDGLRGRSFLDIGCGSGLFSLAAWDLGARPVTSFDVDRDSVACCQHWHSKRGAPAEWTVRQASVLDEEVVRSLPAHEIVYSWGVLHHTGDMRRAIEQATSLVAPQGRFLIAIYNRKRGPGGSKFWRPLKRAYVRGPAPLRWVLEWSYLCYRYQSMLLRGKNPWRYARRYRERRGMRWRTDMVDWIGGWPYEFGTVAEIHEMVRQACPELWLERVEGVRGIGNNTFSFRRLGSFAE